ncbi:MAG: ASCH domain-containing protein [Patescibacteria group bacterium]
MTVQSPYFEEIVSGTKTVELRVYDKKRQTISVGDTIIFTHSIDGNKKIPAVVTGLTLAQTFSELFNRIPPGSAGSTPKDKLIEILHSFYTTEREKQYGVIGIHIQTT